MTTGSAHPGAPLLDAALLAKYPDTGRRYTSYPTADRFGAQFGPAQALRQLKRRGESPSAGPLAIRVHPPVDSPAGYARYLEREIVTQRGAIGRDEPVARLHWDLGAPTTLTIAETSRVVESLRGYFTFLAEGDYAIAVDAARLEAGAFEAFAALGFNRACIGVRAEECAAGARALIGARGAGFRSIGLEVHGSPGAPGERLLATLLALQPDSIAFDGASVADLAAALGELAAAGYLYMGAGRFALPAGPQGAALSTEARLDQLAVGVSAISALGDAYALNHGGVEQYCASLDRGELPVARGHVLDADDLVRREVIERLGRGLRLDYEDLQARFGIDFTRHFAAERDRLDELERDGLIERSPAGIAVTARGRMLDHAICMAFDRYLGEAGPPPDARGRAKRASRFPESTNAS